MANLFEKAKKAAKTTTKKSDHLEVVIEDSNFQSELSRLAKINEKIATLSAEANILKGNVKDRGISEFEKLYEENKKFPGSLDIKAVDGSKSSSFLFITSDRYITIDEERAEELKDEYGDDIVTEDTTFIMDSKLVAKHGKLLSKLINESEIPEHEAEKLISAVTKYSVTKGTVKELDKYKADIPQILEDIQPIYSLKGIKIDE